MFAQVGTFYPFVPIVFLFFAFEHNHFVWKIVGKSWFTVGYVELRGAPGAGVLDALLLLRIGARIVEQRLIAIICNQLAKESEFAQPFSDFDVQLNGVRTLREVRIPAKSLTPEGVLGSA